MNFVHPDCIAKFLKEIDLRADSDTMKTIQNSDRQNAKIASDKKLVDFMQNLLFTHTEIYKEFTDDPDFKRRYQEFIFDIMWEQTRPADGGLGASV